MRGKGSGQMNSITNEYYELADKIHNCRLEIMRMIDEVREIGDILQSIDEKIAQTHIICNTQGHFNIFINVLNAIIIRQHIDTGRRTCTKESLIR